jgi:predicted permease
MRPEDTALDNPNNHWLSIFARVRPGATPEQARAALNASPEIREALGGSGAKDDGARGVELDVRPAAHGLSALRARYGGTLWLLLGVVALVLLIACANVANLLLARAAARQRELSVRVALGAGRARLVRQLLTESVLLAAAGGALGVLFALWGSRLLLRMLSTASMPVALEVEPDWRVLGFTAAVTLSTALFFGLLPAFRASGVAPNAALTLDTRAASAAPARLRLGKLLVVSQVALSLVLLFGAGLFLRTLRNLTGLDTGLDATGVVLVSVDGRNVAGAPERAALQRRILERLRGVPGVVAASQAQITPISGWMMGGSAVVPGYTPRTRRDANVFTNRVSDQYFRTFGTPLLQGRDFEGRDTPASPPLAIINEAFARRFTGHALGQSFSQGSRSYEVIAVVKDAKYDRLRDPAPPTAYFATGQDARPGPSAEFQVRSGVALAALAPSLRDAVLAAAPGASLSFKTFDRQVNDSLVQERVIAALLGFFALLALLLVLIGLHGLIAYGVARRRSEIGIRVALGAGRARVLWLVQRDVLLMTTAGTLLGLLASLGLARFVEGLLYGLAPNDPLTMSGAALLLIALGSLAGYLPARRAASLPPMLALREE